MAAIMIINKDNIGYLPANIMHFRRALISMRNDPDQITYPGSDPESMVEEIIKHYDKFFGIKTITKPGATESLRSELEMQGVVVKDLGRTEINPNV